MTGNPIRNAEKSGTVPLENQMKASRMILITGTAFNVVTKGRKKVESKEYLPASTPRIEALTRMIKKLSNALRTVNRTLEVKTGSRAKPSKVVKTGPRLGSKI
jgi:hypothetical protein